jgi:citrate lyase beta subunit
MTPARLERSMLFVPASRPEMIAKALRSAADAVCIDLEDSVAPEEKPAARANVSDAWRNPSSSPRPYRIFRINGLDTHFAYRDIVEVVEAVGANIDLVMLPKTNSPRDVEFLDTLLTQIEAAHGIARPIGIEAQIESAAGFLNACEIARSSPRLEALIFGPGDFAASMRMPMANIGEPDANDDLYPGHRWHAVMQTIVAAARANGLRCLDGPYAGYKDAAGFERSCRIARAMGFDGKQCIHPAQLAAANAIFSPSREEIAQARHVVEACERSAAEGRGAASLDGKMIDAANIRMARVTLEQAKLIAEENQ